MRHLLGRLETSGGCRDVAASSANPARTAAASIGASPDGPNVRGKCAGTIFPTITLQSVIVSGPPRR